MTNLVDFFYFDEKYDYTRILVGLCEIHCFSLQFEC